MTFFDQFDQLRQKQPRLDLQCVLNENSPYCQYTEKSKNCYMTFASQSSEDCFYNTRVFYCKDCNDCALCHNCELCYECVDCIKSYDCNYCTYCESATSCENCHHCIGTQNCYGCVGLKRAQYQIFNKQYSKEDYEKNLKALRNEKEWPKEKIDSFLEPLIEKTPRAATYGKNNDNCFGENLHNCKNIYWGFDSKKIHDGLYIYYCTESKDLYDCSNTGKSEDCFQIMSGGGLYNCQYCYSCWFSNDLQYCDSVYNSKNCFGCASLNHAKFKIFNIQYTEEEYFKKVAELTAQMKQEGTYGEWFPSTYKEVLTYGL